MIGTYRKMPRSMRLNTLCKLATPEVNQKFILWMNEKFNCPATAKIVREISKFDLERDYSSVASQTILSCISLAYDDEKANKMMRAMIKMQCSGIIDHELITNNKAMHYKEESTRIHIQRDLLEKLCELLTNQRS